MLTLAFDTATSVATCALVGDDETLVERSSTPVRLLADLHEACTEAGVGLDSVSRLVVGTGPGSFTGLRMGLATARALAFALDIPVAGVSTLDALAAAAPAAVPVIDAKRKEVFVLVEGRVRCTNPAELRLPAGTVCVGDGATRYRDVLEAAGLRIPPDESLLHLPRATFHAALALDFGPAEAVEPLYVRTPDAKESAWRRG